MSGRLQNPARQKNNAVDFCYLQVSNCKSMKTAVFQISQRDGQARLVCVPMPSLHSAVNLEALLRMHADTATEIKFLGRFDSVQTASGKQEAEALILKGADRPLGQMITLGAGHGVERG